jgi:hypothetical protein
MASLSGFGDFGLTARCLAREHVAMGDEGVDHVGRVEQQHHRNAEAQTLVLQQMHRFVQVLQQQIAANDLPPGSMIIVNVPMPPTVYRLLRSQAAAVGQTPAQLMGSILAVAAGK